MRARARNRSTTVVSSTRATILAANRLKMYRYIYIYEKNCTGQNTKVKQYQRNIKAEYSRALYRTDCLIRRSQFFVLMYRKI